MILGAFPTAWGVAYITPRYHTPMVLTLTWNNLIGLLIFKEWGGKDENENGYRHVVVGGNF